MKHNRFIFVMFFIITQYAFAQNTMTYQELCTKALTDNHDLKQKELDVQMAERDVKAAKLNRLPSFGGNIYSSYNNGRALDPLTYQYATQNFFYSTGSLESRISVFEGGKQSMTIDKNRNNAAALSLNLANEEQNIRGKILVSYLTILRLKEHQQLVQQKLINNDEQKEKWQLLVNAGRATKSSLNEITVESARLENYYQELAYQVKDELIKLQNLTGENKEELFVKPIILTEPMDTNGLSKEELNQKAQVSILYQQTELNQKLAVNNWKISRSGYAPTVSLIGTLGSGYSSKVSNLGFENSAGLAEQSRNNYYKNVAVNIYVPIFSKFQTKNQVQKAKITIEKTKENQSQTLNNLEEQLQQQNQLSVSTSKRYQIVQSSIQTYEEIIEEATLRYESGRGNVFELLLKQQQLFSLKSNLIDLKYYHYLAKKNIELVEKGKVTVE